jgi:hypothetical protein
MTIEVDNHSSIVSISDKGSQVERMIFSLNKVPDWLKLNRILFLLNFSKSKLFYFFPTIQPT